MQSSSTSLDDLLLHADWVRDLARSLVRDAARADDVVQEVWLAALRRGPTDERNLRGWLRTTARRIAAAGFRGEQAGARREARAARPEALPATDELVARASLQREVARHVLDLEEPYRRVVLLRFFEELPPRAIARRDGVPVATVKTRLQRAQGKLRERLEAEHGGDGGWALALAPLCLRVDERARRAALAREGVRAGRWIAGAVAAASALTLGYVVLRVPLGPERALEDATVAVPSGEEDGPSGAARSAASVALAPASPSGARRAADPSTAPPGASEDARGSATTPARLVDAEGRPLVGLRVRRPGPQTVRWKGGDPIWIGNDVTTLRLALDEQERLASDRAALRALCDQQPFPAEWRATLLGELLPEREVASGPDGGLPVDWARTAEVVEHGWTLAAVLASEEARADEAPLRLVATPAVELRGRVVDERGAPIALARVHWRAPSPLPLAGHALRVGGPPPCTSDADGRFVLRSVPVLEGAHLVVAHDEHAQLERVAPSVDAHGLLLELREPAPTVPELEGRVLDESGRPLAGARVHFGALSTRAEEDGSFTLSVPEPLAGARLVVWAPDHQPWIETGAGDALAARDDGRLWREVVLAAGVSSLRGRVVDAAGRGLPGARVGLLAPTPLDGTLTSLEGRVGARGIGVDTDTEGRFELGGLYGDAPVRLRIFDPATARFAVTEPLAPTSADELLVAFEPVRTTTVRGRVTPPDGEELSDARVAAGFDWLRTPGGGSLFEAGPPVHVRPDGRFVLEDVPLAHAWIRVAIEGAQQTHPVEGLDLEAPVALPSPDRAP